MYTYLTYSESRKKDISKKQNAYFTQTFDSNSMKEALRDFKRDRLFDRQIPDTRRLDDEQISRIIDKACGTTPEGKAVATLMKARGGQAMSADITLELLSRFQSNHSEIPYFPSTYFTTPIFAPVEGKPGTFNRLELQFSMFTSDGGQAYALHPETNQLVKIDETKKGELSEAIIALEIELLDSDTYLAIQKKLLEKNVDPLIIAKSIEDVIVEKLGYRPITFACSKIKIQGIAPKTSPFDYPAKLFEWRDPATQQYRVPDLSGTAYMDLTDFGLGSNTPDIGIIPDWVEKNQEEKTPAELDNDYFRARNISDVKDTWTPLIPLPEYTPTEDADSLPLEIEKLIEELVTFLKALFDKVLQSMDNVQTAEEETMRFDM